ncbi:MAG: hypothetical protein CMG07_00830 [Candidatus Marinimicrobia bacterium]|nr:hypothetical protein [Candidatus Neomarinimicrobiota bacterium]
MRLKIFIPSDIDVYLDKKKIFLLVRPFYAKNGWTQYGETFSKWGLDSDNIQLVSEVSDAEIFLIPYPINYYFENQLKSHLNKYNGLCEKYDLKGFGYIAGDFGVIYPDYSKITYYRMGGFASKLSKLNRGFPAALSDQQKNIYGTKEVSIRSKKVRPTVGFCGHATSSKIVLIYQTIKCVLENSRRFLHKPNRKDYEPIFPSAYMREKILNTIENNDFVNSQFIYRKKYRAGAKNSEDMRVTTLDYYENIKNSDYVLCLRGTGNFSIRLYETLMMGRIPIFINTDCLLPFNNYIDWKDHVVWVEWEDRHGIVDIIKDFHEKISEHQFKKIQIRNRKLWLEILQPKWILTNLSKD